MLVLSRKPGEKIIAGDVTIEIIEVRGNKVSVGITAPKATPVHREEIWNLIHDPERAKASAEASAEACQGCLTNHPSAR